MNSRDKGARGEKEIAALLRQWGFPSARRGQQYSGSPESPDIKGGPGGWHIEVKRVECFNAYDAIEQAKRDAGDDERPVVLHRRNGKEWLAVMPIDAWLRLLGAQPDTGHDAQARSDRRVNGHAAGNRRGLGYATKPTGDTR